MCLNYDITSSAFEQAIGKYNHDRIRGEDHPQHILNQDEVIEIRSLYSQGNVSQKELATQFNVCQQCIWSVVSYRTWTHI